MRRLLAGLVVVVAAMFSYAYAPSFGQGDQLPSDPASSAPSPHETPAAMAFEAEVTRSDWIDEIHTALRSDFFLDDARRADQLALISKITTVACVFGSTHGDFIGDQVDLQRLDAGLRADIESGIRSPDSAWFEYSVYAEYNRTTEAQRVALC